MRLPGRREAIVPERKITDYLLSETHPVGKAKAGYFRSLGYNEKNVDQLKKAFIAIALVNEVTEVVVTPFGTKYIVDGKLATSGGTGAQVRTVWIVEAGEVIPRFVTAYPYKQ